RVGVVPCATRASHHDADHSGDLGRRGLQPRPAGQRAPAQADRSADAQSGDRRRVALSTSRVAAAPESGAALRNNFPFLRRRRWWLLVGLAAAARLRGLVVVQPVVQRLQADPENARRFRLVFLILAKRGQDQTPRDLGHRSTDASVSFPPRWTSAGRLSTSIRSSERT